MRTRTSQRFVGCKNARAQSVVVDMLGGERAGAPQRVTVRDGGGGDAIAVRPHRQSRLRIVKRVAGQAFRTKEHLCVTPALGQSIQIGPVKQILFKNVSTFSPSQLSIRRQAAGDENQKKELFGCVCSSRNLLSSLRCNNSVLEVT